MESSLKFREMQSRVRRGIAEYITSQKQTWFEPSVETTCQYIHTPQISNAQEQRLYLDYVENQKEPPANAGGSWFSRFVHRSYRSMVFMVPVSGLYWKRVTRSSFWDSRRTTNERPSSTFNVS